MQSGWFVCTRTPDECSQPLFSAVLASVSAPHLSPPTLHLVHLFRVSMVVLACRLLRPNPAAYLAPRLPPFLLGRSRLRSSHLGHATASPASLLPGQSRLCPGPSATIAIANNTFLVAIESFSSARTSQERRTRRRAGGSGTGAGTEARTTEKRGTHPPSLVCT